MRIAVFGASGHGRVVAEAVEEAGIHQVAGWIDSTKTAGEMVHGRLVLGPEESMPRLVARKAIEGVVIAVGDNWQRSRIVERLQEAMGTVLFPAVVHPRAIVSRTAQIGEGTVILSGAAVAAGAQVGRFCILNTNSSLDHDGVMEDFSSLAPNVATGGNVRIGTCSAICIGARIAHRINVGDHSVVGAGATVLSEIPDHSLVYGTPATVIRRREPGEKYL